MPKRRKDVILFDAPPVISAWGSAGGKKEGEGPLASAFDYLTQDAAFADENCANWEQAESMLQQKAAGICLRKAGIAAKDVDLTFAGDLQAQCTASNYTLRTLATPFAGLYGACSTMTEALCLGAAFTAAGLGRQILAMTSSHFCAAERRPGQGGVQILSATFGRVQDYGVTDINNMGAAMMPAAASTLLRYFDATGAAPADFDAIFTGDLGQVGSDLLCEQMEKEGVPLPNHYDCGCLLYDVDSQNVQAGGSGAGCSAAVLCAWVLPRLFDGRFKRVLFLSTGALMSQTTFLQGETIPGIAHCVELGGLV